MNNALYENISKSTAHRLSRETNAQLILENPQLFPHLLEIAFDTDDKNHHKACWILELVLEENIDWLFPDLDAFCNQLKVFSNESAMRSIAKICQFSAVEHTKKVKSNPIFLNEKQQQQVTESCFYWLIDDHKVAAKAYAARALFELGEESDWIYQKLAVVLESGFSNHSAAYKAVAREILKAISSPK
ncbi:hypothetical protein [Flavobacterium sp. 3HN19-14]|uniref:hypothetical protein n=1 Tax=Flavobacterium sp. 3HN19-14 TaxID=3448133 RepID=UPI003EE3DBB9